MPASRRPPLVDRSRHLGRRDVRRTPGISCEAVPASDLAGAGMRRHLNESHAGRPYAGAAESFVSFIPLLGRTWFDPRPLPFSRPRAYQNCEMLRPLDNDVATKTLRPRATERANLVMAATILARPRARAGAAPATTGKGRDALGPIRPFPVRQPGDDCRRSAAHTRALALPKPRRWRRGPCPCAGDVTARV